MLPACRYSVLELLVLTPDGWAAVPYLIVKRLARARLRISDNGPVISPEVAQHFFVKWMAETHHGAVEPESRPNVVMIFTVSAPR
jgi:hypothetical protein